MNNGGALLLDVNQNAAFIVLRCMGEQVAVLGGRFIQPVAVLTPVLSQVEGAAFQKVGRWMR
jgi:hypothetical protein